MDVEILAISLAAASAIPSVRSVLGALRARLGGATARMSIHGPGIDVEVDASPDEVRKLEGEVLEAVRRQKSERAVPSPDAGPNQDGAEGHQRM